jgi:hypothetical protein
MAARERLSASSSSFDRAFLRRFQLDLSASEAGELRMEVALRDLE